MESERDKNEDEVRLNLSQIQVEFFNTDGAPLTPVSAAVPSTAAAASNLVPRSKAIPLGRSHTKFGRKVCCTNNYLSVPAHYLIVIYFD